jgi:hypothetical protein
MEQLRFLTRLIEISRAVQELDRVLNGHDLVDTSSNVVVDLLIVDLVRQTGIAHRAASVTSVNLVQSSNACSMHRVWL